MPTPALVPGDRWARFLVVPVCSFFGDGSIPRRSESGRGPGFRKPGLKMDVASRKPRRVAAAPEHALPADVAAPFP
jgi:hypothetical protein